MDQSVFGYLVTEIQTAYSIGLPEVSFIISASFVAGMILPIGIGMLTDIWGARRTLPICLGVSALLVGLQGLAPGILTFAAARIVGFGLSAALSPITNTIVATASPARWRPLMIAILQCAYPLGWLISSLMVAPLIGLVSWNMLFFIGFIVAPIAIWLGRLLPRDLFGPKQKALSETKSPQSLPIIALFKAPHRKPAIFCSLAVFLNAGSVAATTFYLPTFLSEVRGYSIADAALIVGSGYGISVIGYLGSALVSTYFFTRRDTIILWNWIAASLFFVMVWLPQSVFQDFLAFGFLGIFFYGTSAILITYVLEAFPNKLRATAAAACGTACVSGSMAVYPVVVAQIVPHFGWQMAFTIIVPTLLILSGCMMLFLPRRASEETVMEDFAAEAGKAQEVLVKS